MTGLQYTIIRDEEHHMKFIRAVHTNTLTFEEVCETAAAECGMSSYIINAAGQAICSVIESKTAQGFRVELSKLATFYAQIHKVEKDTVDKKTGEYVPVSDKMMIPDNEDASLCCEILKKTNKRFRGDIHFKRNNDPVNLKRTIRKKKNS